MHCQASDVSMFRLTMWRRKGELSRSWPFLAMCCQIATRLPVQSVVALRANWAARQSTRAGRRRWRDLKRFTLQLPANEFAGLRERAAARLQMRVPHRKDVDHVGPYLERDGNMAGPTAVAKRGILEQGFAGHCRRSHANANANARAFAKAGPQARNNDIVRGGEACVSTPT